MNNPILNIVITGSEGFLGNQLKQLLVEKKRNFQGIDLKSGTNLEDVIVIPNQTNILVHLAASTSVMASFEKPGEFYSNNIGSLIKSLEWCRENNGKIIYVSSYVYGKSAKIPTTEEHPISAHNPYAQSKLIGEELCLAYFRDHKVPFIIFRPFNIYGEGHSTEFVISSILEQVKSGITDIKIQNPNPKRDFIHVKDVVEAIYLGLDSTLENEIFNLCSESTISIGEVCAIIEKLSARKLNFTYERHFERKGDVDITLGSNSKAKKLLNWQPKYSLEVGLKEIISHFV
jgi:nucleoside-diphosphate-sugar epimerase